MADMESLKLLMGMAPDEGSKLLALQLQLKKPGSPDPSALIAMLIKDNVLDAAQGFSLLTKLSDAAKPAAAAAAPPMPPVPKKAPADAKLTGSGHSWKAETMAKFHLKYTDSSKPAYMVFMKKKGKGAKQFVHPYPDVAPDWATEDDGYTGPQEVTVQVQNATVIEDGLECDGSPVPVGTTDPEFSILTTSCCPVAQQHLRVGGTWFPPVMSKIDKKTGIAISGI